MSFEAIIRFFRVMRDSKYIDQHNQIKKSVSLVSSNLYKLSSKDTHRFLKYLLRFERVAARLQAKYNFGGEDDA